MDESQKMGMVTKVWGPAAWLFLHCIAFNYTPEKHEEYKLFFESLANGLPCKSCRDNYSHIIYKSNLKLSKQIFKSRHTFAYWLFQVHNHVQNDIYAKSGLECEKPMYSNSFEDFHKIKRLYESFRAKCTKNAYGCVVPKKGLKLRTRIYVKHFSKKCNEHKHSIITI